LGFFRETIEIHYQSPHRFGRGDSSIIPPVLAHIIDMLLHGDSAGFRIGPQWHFHGENTVTISRMHSVGIDRFGHMEDARESTARTLAMMRSLTLFPLHFRPLALDRQYVVYYFDLDSLRIYTGELHGEAIGVSRLTNIHRWSPRNISILWTKLLAYRVAEKRGQSPLCVCDFVHGIPVL
jgi:hypothetical protein